MPTPADIDKVYYLEGSTLLGLRRIASQLSSGTRLSADERRDMAQWMQARLNDLIVAEGVHP